MPISLDPGYANEPGFEHRPIAGRRGMSDVDIGRKMAVALALSIEEYRDTYNKHRGLSRAAADVSRSVEDLIKVAQKEARRRGVPLKQVLREHQRQLESGGGAGGRFVQQTTGYGGKDTRDDEQREIMEAQDERRSKAKLSVGTKRAALAVDRDERQRQVMLFDPTVGAPPPSAGPSVMRRPPALHHLGGDTPYADQLRLTAPPAETKEGSVLKLKHNPAGGGGFHNPHTL